jgi:hypothetical protein
VPDYPLITAQSLPRQQYFAGCFAVLRDSFLELKNGAFAAMKEARRLHSHGLRVRTRIEGAPQTVGRYDDNEEIVMREAPGIH